MENGLDIWIGTYIYVDRIVDSCGYMWIGTYIYVDTYMDWNLYHKVCGTVCQIQKSNY